MVHAPRCVCDSAMSVVARVDSRVWDVLHGPTTFNLTPQAVAFEEAAILTSTDGVNFAHEQEIPEADRVIEGQKKKKDPWEEAGSSKSLRDQLAEAKEAKDADWKEKNNPFSKCAPFLWSVPAPRRGAVATAALCNRMPACAP